MHIKRRLLLKLLKIKGCPGVMAELKVDTFMNDLSFANKIPLKSKLWAYKRGFLSSHIKNYGLTEANYKGYLSDLDYARIYPLNGYYGKWIDDKLTSKMMLYKFNDFLPAYYYYITHEGVVVPSVDLEEPKKTGVEGVVALLMAKSDLAVKLTSGSASEGFIKISYEGSNFYWNNTLINREELVTKLSKLRGYIVTEWLVNHEECSKYNSTSGNTIRVMVVNPSGLDPIIANAMFNIGLEGTGAVDFSYEGCMSAIIDVTNGHYGQGKFFKGLKVEDMPNHPNSLLKIEGVIPFWPLIVDKLIEISLFIPQVSYLGYDIMITKDTFKIIEINSNQSLYFQNYNPLLTNNLAAPFFNRLLLKRG